MMMVMVMVMMMVMMMMIFQGATPKFPSTPVAIRVPFNPYYSNLQNETPKQKSRRPAT